MKVKILLVSIAIVCVIGGRGVGISAGHARATSRTEFVDDEVDRNEIPVDEIPFKIETDYASK